MRAYITAMSQKRMVGWVVKALGRSWPAARWRTGPSSTRLVIQEGESVDILFTFPKQHEHVAGGVANCHLINEDGRNHQQHNFGGFAF